MHVLLNLLTKMSAEMVTLIDITAYVDRFLVNYTFLVNILLESFNDVTQLNFLLSSLLSCLLGIRPSGLTACSYLCAANHLSLFGTVIVFH